MIEHMVEEQWEIVRKFVFSCKSNVCFLRIPDSVITEDFKKDFCVIDMSRDFSPYKPFLTVLEDSSEKPDSAFISEKAYSVQKDIFLSYFEKGLCDGRWDLPLPNELVYEQIRFSSTILELLNKYAHKNYLILNSQCLSRESVELIRALEKSPVKAKFAFCFTSVKNDMDQTYSFKMMEEYSSKPNYLFLSSQALAISHDKTEYKRILDLPQEVQFGVLFKTLRNNRIFMVHQQLKEFSLWLSENFGQFDFVDDQQRELSLELAKSLAQCGLYDEAILYLNDIVDVQIEDSIHAQALYQLSSAFSAKKSLSLAQKYYSLAEKFFVSGNDDNLAALGAMLDFHIAKKISAEDTIAKYQKALALLEKQGLWNNYISVSVSVPWKLMNDESQRKALDEEIDKCLEMAKRIDNQHLVSTCCHWRGIICSHYGEIDDALAWYDKCNAIRTEIGELIPILNIRNGLCYDATGRAMYKRAYDLVNGVINRLLEIGDFASITDTLKNISYSLFYSRHFTEAYEIFNTISHFLQIFNMSEMANSSFLPSLEDMLIFKSIISFDQGDYIRARINHSNIMQNLDQVTKEDYPFIYFIEAVLHADSKDIDASEAFFCKCISEFSAIKSKMAHKVVFAYYEYAVNLSRLGYEKLSRKYMKLGFELAKKEGFKYFTKEKKNSEKEEKTVSVSKYLKGVEKFDSLNVSMQALAGKAEKEQILTQLHKRIHDYQFINKIKAGYVKDMNIKKYIQSVLFDIEEYTLADEICFGVCENGEYKVYDFITHKMEQAVTPDVLKSLFKKSKKSDIAQLVYNDELGVYFGNASYAEYKFGIVIIPSERNAFTVDVLNTLKIALSSIQSQVVIYKQEEHLMVMSSTDQLSRLKNRHAFQECIALESERVRRYQQRKETVIQIAVAFIDLDNFKYYNDNFGHNVGDLLIKNFANLLRETCRKIDFISRFGGDEFVIIMVDTNADEGKRVYKRLNESLEAHGYFIPQIRALLKVEELNIPENRRIGFSMGISTNHDAEKCDDLDLVVQNADKALYYSKEHQKGSVTVWADIKDELKS